MVCAIVKSYSSSLHSADLAGGQFHAKLLKIIAAKVRQKKYFTKCALLMTVILTKALSHTVKKGAFVVIKDLFSSTKSLVKPGYCDNRRTLKIEYII